MALWRRVDELIERASTVSALHSHRLHLYAAWRWRELGRPVEPELADLERGALVQRLATPGVVSRVRAGYDGPMILLKGAEVAALYPRPELRPSLDLDLLVPDAPSVHRVLIASGFRVYEDTPESHHHLPTLEWPGLLIRVDVHGAPSWPTWRRAPGVDELFDAASSESVLGHGILTLPATHHALLLAAHMWREVPFTRLGQVLDVWLMAQRAEGRDIEALAERWGIEALWSATAATARGVLLGEQPRSRAARRWTSRLESMRERTVIGTKRVELTSPFAALPFTRAARVAGTRLLSDVRPGPDQTWGGSLKRTAGAVLQSFRPRAARDRVLEAESRAESAEKVGSAEPS